jgi:Ino eighty subunit 1
MRARVRTYHSIPALQAKQSSQAYKQLQDGPRLKSILKGAQESRSGDHVPSTPDDISRAAKPRTNPVNLIFVLSQYAPKVSETHFQPNQDFFDIFIRTTMSSRSRATAFLWLLWWYLESDFTADAALSNPFGPGVGGENGEIPCKVPLLEMMTEEESLRENVDTEEEVAFGEAKKVEREGTYNTTVISPRFVADSIQLSCRTTCHLLQQHRSVVTRVSFGTFQILPCHCTN